MGMGFRVGVASARREELEGQASGKHTIDASSTSSILDLIFLRNELQTHKIKILKVHILLYSKIVRYTSYF